MPRRPRFARRSVLPILKPSRPCPYFPIDGAPFLCIEQFCHRCKCNGNPRIQTDTNFLLDSAPRCRQQNLLRGRFHTEIGAVYRITMIGQQYKRLTSLLVIAVLAAMLAGTAFTAVDVSSEAEPSWVERRFASVFLDMKLRAKRPTKLSLLTPTGRDLERGSDIYQEQCAFCHGATRGRIAPFAKSFSPRPPQFVIEPSHGPTWMDAYVIQHGVRWSGMPAFRGLSEADAWRVALYVEGRSQPKE
jgi:mono/diheme cytochrome c family protein